VHFLADTVTIIRHFANVGKIGKAAKLILLDADNGKHKVLISIISMVEILYLSERNRIPLKMPASAFPAACGGVSERT
jgi:PIN domain nuclease of toxin-antitoxin system